MLFKGSQVVAEEVGELYQLMQKSLSIAKQVEVVKDLEDVTGYLEKEATFSTELILHLSGIEINW